MSFRYIQIIILVSTFYPGLLFTQTIEDYDQLVKAGMDEYQVKGDIVKAIELFSEAEIMALDNQWNKELYIVKNGLGNFYQMLSNYGIAMEYYSASLNIARNHEEGEEYIPTILNNIGILFAAEGDNTKAIEYYEEAVALAKKNNNERVLVMLSINLSNIFIELKNHTKAQYYINMVKDIPKNQFSEQVLFINLARTYYLEGDIEKALTIVESECPDCDSNPSGCLQCTIEFLSYLYDLKGDLDKAISLRKSGLLKNLSLESRIEFYGALSDLYYKKGDLELSINYKDSVITFKDSLTKINNRGLYESNKVKFQVQEYQYEISQQQTKQQAERKIFIILTISGLVLLFFIYKSLRNRAIKHRQQKVIAENNEKIVTLELENVKNNLAEKNRKLSAKALYLSGRNELIEDIIESLTNLKEVSNSKEITNYIRTLKSHLRTDNEWDEFIKHFEDVNPDFLQTLKTKHPDLSPNDLRFICYMYMNLNLKEISIIFNITYNAARIRKRRVMEKMGLDKDGELYDYIIAV